MESTECAPNGFSSLRTHQHRQNVCKKEFARSVPTVSCPSGRTCGKGHCWDHGNDGQDGCFCIPSHSNLVTTCCYAEVTLPTGGGVPGAVNSILLGLRAFNQHLPGFLIQALPNAFSAQLHLASFGDLGRSSFSPFNRAPTEEMGSRWKTSDCQQLSTACWACWHQGAFVLRMSLCPGRALRSPQKALLCLKGRKHFHSYSEMLLLLKQKPSSCPTPLFPSLG